MSCRAIRARPGSERRVAAMPSTTTRLVGFLDGGSRRHRLLLVRPDFPRPARGIGQQEADLGPRRFEVHQLGKREPIPWSRVSPWLEAGLRSFLKSFRGV